MPLNCTWGDASWNSSGGVRPRKERVKALEARGIMATYVVAKVRKEVLADASHEHIEGGCAESGTHYTRHEVVDSIKAGNTWKTKADGYEATVEAIGYCPKPQCLAKPYLRTNPDITKKDNLENLDRC